MTEDFMYTILGCRIQSFGTALLRFANTGDTGYYALTIYTSDHMTAMRLYKQLRRDMARLSNAGIPILFNGKETTFDDFARVFLRSFKNAAWDALVNDPEQAAFFLDEMQRIDAISGAGGEMTL